VVTRSTTPVFCDQSGVRSTVLQWGGRGIGLLLLLLCAALGLTVGTRVEIPGLTRLLDTTEGSSELFDAPVRRNGQDRQVTTDGKVMIPQTRQQTVARERKLPAGRPTAARTVEPVAERSTATRTRPAATTPAATSSAAPRRQTSPTREPSPTTRPRNPNAAVPRQNPNAQGPPTEPPGQAKDKSKGKGKGKAGSAPSPETEVESPTS
jgi:hypothetical protein